MKALTYVDKGLFELQNKPKPTIYNEKDAIVRITLASICTSDLHIKNGSVLNARKGITIGHEIVGVVEETGTGVHKVSLGDRVTVNVETFCGECFFCKNGYVNNCVDKNGGWALGCRIDGGQTEYVRVPYADMGLNIIPDGVSDEQALFAGDILATGYWAAKISGISEADTVLIIGAGPTGICTLLCAMLKNPKNIIVCEKDKFRAEFVKNNYENVIVCGPEECEAVVKQTADNGGADVVFEVAGSKDSFKLSYECARPNATVVIVALYDENMVLPLPAIYGKNLTFKTGGVDGCDCDEILKLIKDGKIDTLPLISHYFGLDEIETAYELFENRKDNAIKIAVGSNRKNVICTRRLMLRPVRMDDTEAVHAYAGDKSINMMLFLPNDTIEETYVFVKKSVLEWEKEKPLDYEYVIIYEYAIIGGINLEVTDEENVYEIGWLVHKDYRNKGIVTEAAEALLNHAFVELKAKKIIAHCDSLNKASENVMKKNKMVCISDSGTRTYEKTGVTSGEYTYEITAEVWNKNRPGSL